MLKRLPPYPTLFFGFVVGLFLASIDHILPPYQYAQGPLKIVVVLVDWVAPPLAGAFLGGALLWAVRHQRLLSVERAAAQVMAERLAGTERRQAIWVVAAAVAHDLKNPLHNLQLLVEEMEDDPGSWSDLLPRLRENVLRATERLSELSRAGQAPEESQAPLDLLSSLAELKERLQPAAAASGTALMVDCPRGLSVRADPLALRSAVENVAANALEALGRRGRGGRLVLRGGLDPSGQVVLFVEDDGPGIPEALRERLFIPFTSGSSSGTGLGLAIARALARAGGGDLVCADSNPGHTAFRFTFQGPKALPAPSRSIP